MPEKYNLAVEKGQVSFTLYVGDIPEALLRGAPVSSEYAIFTRLGDPDLLECVVWRQKDESGGIFVVRAADQTLYGAVAENGLTFSLALAYFGDLVAKARYGADIFENMDEHHA